MDLSKELEVKRTEQQQMVAHLEQLNQQKLLIAQEVLRLDGEIRLLERMAQEGGKDEPDRDKSKDWNRPS